MKRLDTGFRRHDDLVNFKSHSKLSLSYDPKYNVTYIRFHEKLGQVSTIKISNDMNIDIAPDGTVYGVELLNPKEQLTGDNGVLIIESCGRRQEVALVA